MVSVTQSAFGLNPDPARWDGVLLPFAAPDLAKVVPDALSDKRERKRITMAQAKLSDGQELLAVNDFYIGAKSHVSARYELHLGERVETHSSSGVIVSTGLGSTGWVRSLLTGAAGISGHNLDQRREHLREHGFAWDADHFFFTVREPFPSRVTQVRQQVSLRIVSQMAGNGVIFSDGVEADFLEFNSGMTVTIDVAGKSGQIVL